MTWRLSRWLEDRRSLGAILAIGMALAAVTLKVGFFTDDYSFIAYLEDAVPKRASAIGLYDFVRGEPGEVHALTQRGPFPWWTDPALKVRFFRPLSSALFALDHSLFGHAPLGYHVHALLWYALFLGGVLCLYRLVIPVPLRGWCALVFALEAAHCEPVGWLASRHLLVSTVPAIWGLVAHVASREHGFRFGRWLAAPGLALGLLGGEAALGVALYWIAYEVFGASKETAARSKLVRASLPIGIVGAYLLAYKALDFGAAHSAAYVEPLSDPRGFAVAMVRRVPIMLGETFLGVPSALGAVMPSAPFVALGVAGTAVVVALFSAVLRALSDAEKKALLWLAIGAGSSLVVSVGGFPGSRLLLVPSIGSSAIVGAILCHGFRALERRGFALAARRVGWVVLFAVHLVLAPLSFIGTTSMVAGITSRAEAIELSLDGALPPPGSDRANAPAAFLIASDPVAGLYVGAMRAVRAPETVSGWSMLSMSRVTHDIRRTDERTLVIRTDRPMLKGAFDGVFRDPSRAPLRAGDRVQLDDAVVTVLSAEDGYPSSIEVRFAAPLENERYRLLVWRDERLVRLELPIGDHIVIPWTPGPTGFF